MPECSLPLRRYTAAGGIIIKDKGRLVLLLLRPGRQGPDGQPEVRLPKGHLEPGESPLQAALREVREEAGLLDLQLLADLGRQTVEFDWQEHHYIREEHYFLLALSPTAGQQDPPEKQFERLWLSWEEALLRPSYEAEREWVQRALVSLQNIADQDAQQADNDPQMKE